MTITTTEDKKENGFPKAMKFVPDKTDSCTRFIVYFEEYKRGAVIDPGDSKHEFGDASDKWVMSQFVDFHGKIVLEF